MPRPGMLAVLRNRHGIVVSVDPFDGPSGRLHFVRVEYTDADGVPDDTVIWEREAAATVLEPTTLPRVCEESPMLPSEFDALTRASRWAAMTPFLNPTDMGKPADIPVAAPFLGAIQVDDFQLVPLIKALKMPRISLLLADDVGLGKTIEAGLILSELFNRRRIRRVLIITPASLRQQWVQEMHEKFSFHFDLVDRAETHALQRRMGLDSNPWRTFTRIITSYHFLRQPDILEQFLATCRADLNAPQAVQLPWDLLIVDEAHNLMPAHFGADSDLSKMLKAISPYFEHKLFLTATPHNGYTRSFSGLLERLDPVRFVQTSEFKSEERERLKQVLVRRLKSEINELDTRLKRPRRFPRRFPEPQVLYFHPDEKRLSLALTQLRGAIRSHVAKAEGADKLAGIFASEILNKRLLSCPYTFADSWLRFKAGLQESEKAETDEVKAAHDSAEEDTDDDLEKEGRLGHVARMVGAWLLPMRDALTEEIAEIDQSLKTLHLDHDDQGKVTRPHCDARLECLFKLIDRRLRDGECWRHDERLVVFTEYKTTLDYIMDMVLTRYPSADHPDSCLCLYGGMDIQTRDDIKNSFNDPASPVRILFATDAASEGLNLHETARLLMHYDIPWNPMRLEQRNGRLDRHGQARDVTLFHFASEEDEDLRFLARVIEKVESIREDLGSVRELFEAAFQRRFVHLDDTHTLEKTMEMGIAASKTKKELAPDEKESNGVTESEAITQFMSHLDLSPKTLFHTLDCAMGQRTGRPRIEPDKTGHYQLAHPVPAQWQDLVDEHLRRRSSGKNALLKLAFDPELLVEKRLGRPVFRKPVDTALLHLGHPLFRQALATFAMCRFPGKQNQATRWLVRRGPLPDGCQALIILHLEELAINELREPFHHWVRSLRLPVVAEQLKKPMLFLSPGQDDATRSALPQDRETARELWVEIENEIRTLLKDHANTLTESLTALMGKALAEEVARARTNFDLRLKEVKKQMQNNTVEKLKRELADKRQSAEAQASFEFHEHHQRAEIKDLEEDIRLRTQHYSELRDYLSREKPRVVKKLLPARFSLRGKVQVIPVSVEIRLPELEP